MYTYKGLHFPALIYNKNSNNKELRKCGAAIDLVYQGTVAEVKLLPVLHVLACIVDTAVGICQMAILVHFYLTSTKYIILHRCFDFSHFLTELRSNVHYSRHQLYPNRGKMNVSFPDTGKYCKLLPVYL